MKRMAIPALLFALALSLCACSDRSSYEGPPEGWKVHLVRNLSFRLPENWTKEDVGHGGSYYHPPDGGMLMVMPAAWGLSDLSTGEGAAAAFDYLFSVMDRNLPGFTMTTREDAELGGRHAVRAGFVADGAGGSRIPGEAVFIASAQAGEIYQFVFVLDGPAGGELESAMEEIIASVGGGGTAGDSSAKA